MTNEELLSVAEIVERLVTRFHKQAADHETKMAEHRASFGARTEADAKLIAGLREERNGLLTQVQDMREEIIRVNDAHGRTIVERDALRAEVAALQERLRASIARGDFAQMEVAALKSQTPKHPVKVGEYVKRLTGFNTTLAGEIGKVTRVDDDAAEIEYEVKRPNGETGVWCAKNCEPCDPPNHDTEAGKAAAQNAEKTEQVADEIKVGDLVEVVSNRGRNTWLVDVGSLGIVTSVEDINDSISVHLDDVPGKRNALAGYVSFCDVRKVTT